ncbi:DNA-binding transcriptional regulator, LysR family [Faunimonas pinastri]|uniref:DNA-binding transcriptional regulator, LysR family n=1 Tax=Faunimonas pinastri TaxID=1855383 RepID=A0A1H9ME28_9HYPH|nr:LysR family transcriptional regulator [Faunimonas pinastri]SER21413.1 DNA-binding transcriptional regulator, LysR family [Faunimonas pinastri]
MTLEQLRIFVAVAERQHVTRAAEALNLTQSAVSAAISALENRHAVSLFDRVGRRIELTEAGRLFLGEAKALLARAADAETVLADLAGLKTGSLAISASQTIASYWLPVHLAAFRRRHPEVSLHVRIGNTAQVAHSLIEGETQLGFVEGQVDEPALTGTTVGTDRLVLIVAPDHPWAGRGRVEPADIAASDWVLREQGSGTRSEFEADLARAGVDLKALRIAMELPSNEAVRAAVEAGLGASAISGIVVESGIRAGSLAPVAFPLSSRSFRVLHHRQRKVSRAAEAFLACIDAADGRDTESRT